MKKSLLAHSTELNSNIFRSANKAERKHTKISLWLICLLLLGGMFGANAQTTFNYTGGQQTWVVPAGVTSVDIECWGAEGGFATSGPAAKGGYAKGTLAVTPGETLYIYVGGQGGNTGGAGYNGGGTGANTPRGGGGGASDVRQGGTALSNRKIVAGGAGGCWTCGTYPGGAGGGTSGSNGGGGSFGYGGTQTAGGAGFVAGAPWNGTLGNGGSTGTYTVSGGGGGYYGGGAGLGAGGGSSYIGGVTNGTTTAGQRSGHGQVIISYCASACCYTAVAQETNPLHTAATGCSNGTFKLGAGAWYDITVTQNTWYNFTWANGGANNSGFCAAPQDGNAVGFNTNQSPWFSGTTTKLRVSAIRTSDTWVATSATMTYRYTQLSYNPLETTVTPTGICGGTSVTLKVNDKVGKGGVIDHSNWAVGSSAPAGYSFNQTTAGENALISGTDPWGKTTVIWEGRASGDGNGDGGWNSSNVPIDNTKMYRYSVWVKRTVQGTAGRCYFGLQSNTGGATNLANAVDGNPYFWYSGTPAGVELPTGEWVLMVGYVHPVNYAGGTEPTSGRYLLNGGKFGGIYGDYKWTPGTTSASLRTYLFYSDATAKQQWVYPRIDVVDGSEPTIADLLAGFDKYDGLADGASWQWYSGSCGGTAVGTGASVTVAPSSTTRYFVRAEGGTYCAGTTNCKEADVIVNPAVANPTIIPGSSTTFCSGGSVQLTASDVNLAGSALNFTGGQYLNFGNPPALKITGNQTIEMWLKPSNLAAGRQNPYDKAYGGEGTITQEPDGTLNYYYGTNGGNAMNYQGFGSVSTLTQGQWNHIALVRDFTNNQLRWYINGTLTSTATPSYFPAVAGGNPVRIGLGYTGVGYEGQIDEVRVWNVARTTADIQTNMNKPIQAGTAGLAGYWRFDETAGTIVVDASGNSNTGTFGSPAPTWVNPSGAPMVPSYTWSPATGLNTTTGPVVTASPTSNQTYTVTAASPYGCANGTRNQAVTVTPNAAVSSVTAGTTPQCIGSTTTYTVSGVVLGGGSGAWSSSNGTVASVNASTGVVTAVGAGTCNIIYTVTGGCGGTKTASKPYTVTPTANAGTVAAGTTPQCIGATTTYTVSGVVLGGGSGAWSSSNGSVATVNASTGLVTAVGAGTCNIIYTVTGGCGGTKTASKPYTVTPTANAGTVAAGTTPQCIGATTTYTVSGVVLGGGSGAWSSSNGSVATVNASTGLVTAVGAGTCNIIYTVTGGCGGTKTASKPYTVTPTANAGTVAAGTTPQCIGATTTYTVSGVVLGGGSGAWSSSNGSVATVNASTGLVTAVGAGTCNIIYTVTGGCGGTKTASKPYTVTPTANAGTVAAGTTPQCIGATTTYTVSGVVLGGGSGAWSSSNGSVATVNASTGLVTAVGAGTCNIIYTVTGGCGGTKTASKPYTVTPTANAGTVAAGTTPQCIGATTTYTVSGVVLGGGSGAWSSSNGTVASVNASTGVVTAVGAGTCNIIYTVTGGCGGTKTASKPYTVTPTANAGTVTAGTTPQCIGATTTYTVSGVVLGGGSGAWSSSNGSVATVNASTGLVTAVGAGTCNIIYTVTGGCGGTKTASQPYTVTPTASAGTVAAGTTPQCIGATTTYTVSGVVLGGGSGAWSSSNSLVATVNASTGLVTAVGAGTCNIVYTVTGGCGGTKTASQPYTVTPTASAGTVAAGTTPQCIGATTTYTVSGVVLGGGSGAWSSSNGSVATVNASTGLVTAVGAGTCNIIYTVTGGCGGTKTASQPYTVTPTTVPGSITGGSSPICLGSSTGTLTLGGNTGSVVKWQSQLNGGGWNDIANTALTYSEVPSSAGTWEYRAVVQSGTCAAANSNAVTITVNAAPAITITVPGNDSTGCNNEIFTLNTTISGGGGGSISYQWAIFDYGSNSYTDSTGAIASSLGTKPLVNLDNNNNKLYKFKVTYNRTGSGCSAASDEIEITIFPTPSLTSTMEDCASTVVDNGNDKWDYIYTQGSASTPGFMVSDSSGGAELVYPANNGVQSFKIYRVPMGSGSHDFKIVDDNGCIAVSTLSKNSALPTTVPTTLPSTNNGQCYVKGFNEWVHIRKQNSSSEVIASVQDNGVDLGMVTATSYLESTTPSVNNMGATCNGTPQAAMRRHFVVKSSNYPDPSTKFQDNNANPTNVNLRLYFTDADFADLSNASTANNVPGNQCTEDDDIINKQNLYLTKYSDYGQLGNEDGDYMNNTFTSAYFKVFNVGNVTNPLAIQDSGFDTEFGTNGSNIHYAALSVSEFSEFWLHGSTSGAPLPVEMLYIEAKNINNEYIKINWATATELNNRMFEVERSTDGISFAKIGTVMGNGTSTERHDYSYNDKTAAVGIRYYYRLKQIDFDEAYEYSPVVSEMLKGEDLFKVSEFVPNPAADNAKIFITTGKEQGIQIEMHNYIGEVVKHGAMYLNKGNNTVSFDFADLAAGTYTTRIVSGTNTYIRRVVITR